VCRALGVLLYTIVFGENPFHTKDDIIRGQYAMPRKLNKRNEAPGRLTVAALQKLLHGMLSYELADRLTLPEILRSEWLQKECDVLRQEYQSVSTATLV
jgi:serine/threonine protein kinase